MISFMLKIQFFIVQMCMAHHTVFRSSSILYKLKNPFDLAPFINRGEHNIPILIPGLLNGILISVT